MLRFHIFTCSSFPVYKKEFLTNLTVKCVTLIYLPFGYTMSYTAIRAADFIQVVPLNMFYFFWRKGRVTKSVLSLLAVFLNSKEWSILFRLMSFYFSKQTTPGLVWIFHNKIFVASTKNVSSDLNMTKAWSNL